MDFSGIDRTERESRARHNERMERIHNIMTGMTEERRNVVEDYAIALEDECHSSREASEKLLEWLEGEAMANDRAEAIQAEAIEQMDKRRILGMDVSADCVDSVLEHGGM